MKQRDYYQFGAEESQQHAKWKQKQAEQKTICQHKKPSLPLTN